jgi:hypothetical protein
MKKMSTLFAAIALLIASFASTQLNAQFTYGVKAGASRSTFKTTSNMEEKAKTGFVAGVYGNYNIVGNLSLQAELLYAQLGSKDENSVGGNGKYNFNYLQIPVVARYEVWNGLYAVAGAQFGQLLSAKTTANGHSENIKENVKKTDLGIVGGLGYELKRGIGAELRYIPGIKDISQNSKTIKNVNWQLTLHYRF